MGGGGWKREGNLPDARVHRFLFPRSGRRRKDPCSGESIIQGSRGTLNTSLPLVYPWGLLNSSLRYGILSHDNFPPPSSTHTLIFYFISPPSRVGGTSSHVGVMSWELGHRKKAESCNAPLDWKLNCNLMLHLKNAKKRTSKSLNLFFSIASKSIYSQSRNILFLSTETNFRNEKLNIFRTTDRKVRFNERTELCSTQMCNARLDCFSPVPIRNSQRPMARSKYKFEWAYVHLPHLKLTDVIHVWSQTAPAINRLKSPLSFLPPEQRIHLAWLANSALLSLNPVQ